MRTRHALKLFAENVWMLLALPILLVALAYYIVLDYLTNDRYRP